MSKINWKCIFDYGVETHLGFDSEDEINPKIKIAKTGDGYITDVQYFPEEFALGDIEELKELCEQVFEESIQKLA